MRDSSRARISLFSSALSRRADDVWRLDEAARKVAEPEPGGGPILRCAGFEKGAPVYYGFDGSDCTLVEIQGVRTILGPDEFEEALGNGLYNALVGLLREPGHATR